MTDRKPRHEDLDVYRCALDAHRLVLHVIHALGRGNADLADQLRRASRSVVLNIAEAAGKSSAAEQRRIFQIARGSALECRACLDIIELESLATATDLETLRTLLLRSVAMLTRLCLPR